ncbi:hypothetical protein Csa_011792, partial [Cucumis sativus]
RTAAKVVPGRRDKWPSTDLGCLEESESSSPPVCANGLDFLRPAQRMLKCCNL